MHIPHYEQKQMQLLDKEDEVGVVQDNFEKFQQMYHPIIEREFSDVMQINSTTGALEIEKA